MSNDPKTAAAKKQPPNATATKSTKTLRQQTIREVRRKKTRAEIEAAPKRKRGDPWDSCGKPGDPHRDDGKLSKRQPNDQITPQARIRLENRYPGGLGLSTAELKLGDTSD